MEAENVISDDLVDVSLPDQSYELPCHLTGLACGLICVPLLGISDVCLRRPTKSLALLLAYDTTLASRPIAFI